MLIQKIVQTLSSYGRFFAGRSDRLPSRVQFRRGLIAGVGIMKDLQDQSELQGLSLQDVFLKLTGTGEVGALETVFGK